MKTFNRIELIGFIMNDPTVKNHENGSRSCVLTMKTIEYYKETTDKQYHQLVFWNGVSEKLTEIVRKGDCLFIYGKLRYTRVKVGDGIFVDKPEIVIEGWTNLSNIENKEVD